MSKKDGHSSLYVLSLTMGNILFGFGPVLQKFTFPYGGSGLLTAFYSSAFGLIPLFILIKYNHLSLKSVRPIAGKLAVLCIGSSGALLFLWSSYNYIPTGLATTLHYIYPMAIAVAMTVFYHEPFTGKKAVALLLVLCGIARIGASGGATLNPTGMVLALVSGFFWAFYIIYMEKSGLCEQPSPLISFCTTFANVPFALLVCAVTGKLVLYSAPCAWGIVVAVALLHRTVACSLFQIGLRRVEPVSAGILCTFEPVSALVFGYFLLGEAVSARQLSGLIFILSGIIVNVLAGKKRSGS